MADDETHADLGKALVSAIGKYVGNPGAADSMRETLGQLVEMKGQSTSAQLRQTQHDLAASQADLTRVEEERDYLAGLVGPVSSELEAAQRQLDEARAEAKEWRGQAALYLAQRDDALHNLAHARFHHAHCPTEEKP